MTDTTNYPAAAERDVLSEYDALVFDLDGVITDTAAIHAAAWKQAMDQLLARLGNHASPFDIAEDYRRHIDGRPRLEGAAAFLDSREIRLERGSPDDPPDRLSLYGLTTHKNDLFLAELDRRGVRVFPDAAALLGRLAELAMRCAVVTASENGRHVLASAGLLDRFDVTVTGVEARQLQLPGKPAPDTFLRAAEQLGVPPQRCVVLEDAVSGVQAGRAGGFGLVVGVDRDSRRDELGRSGADVVLSDLSQLPELTVDALASYPGRSLDRTFEAFLICPDPDDAEGELDGTFELLVDSGAQVALAYDDPGHALTDLVDQVGRDGIAAGLVLAIGWVGQLSVPERAQSATVISVDDASPGQPLALPVTRWLSGGWPALRAVLADQIQRRRTGRTPADPSDPRWSLVIRGDDLRAPRALQALLTIADTQFGTRGRREEESPRTMPTVLAAGIYDESIEPPGLVEGPGWTGLQLATPIDPLQDSRTLDLRTGVLYRTQPAVPVPLRSARFASLARPGLQALRAEGAVSWLHAGVALTPPVGDGIFTRVQRGHETVATSTAEASGGIRAAAAQQESLGEGGGGSVRVVERLVALRAHPRRVPPAEPAEALLAEGLSMGFDQLLAEQRRAWARRWGDAQIDIVGDPDNELAVRFALFQLMAAAPVTGEAAIGPRGLSGPVYRGHVFWDADVFILPFLAATCPAAARAMLRYRLRRLPGARRLAAAHGFDGIRFPWESARTGIDVTPTQDRSPEGEVIPILTGPHEEHITADVLWAAMQLVAWTGGDDLSRGPGRSLLVETARYWASRVQVDEHGAGHIDAVIGPDEYHEVVDDNTFTNVMARWNLRTAAEHAATSWVDPDEASQWTAIADGLVDNVDPGTGVYEQFAGFFDLAPASVRDFAEPPFAADLLLGRERVSRSQIIKQPDVLMLHHLVPDEVAPGSLRPNLDFYLPRCAHGSSLSPAIHASLLARDGRPDEALHWFDMACQLDLQDLTGTTAGGLHMATFGGLWQAVVLGFAGVRPRADGLQVDPALPQRWTELSLRLRFRGARVGLTLRHDLIRVEPDRPVDVHIGGAPKARVGPPGTTWHRSDSQWRN